MASTRAPLDIMISGPDPKLLSRYANRVLQQLQGLPGLVDVRRTWYFDEREYDVSVDPSRARFYGTSTERVSQNLRAAIDGLAPTDMRLEDFLDIPIRVDYRSTDLDGPGATGDVYVDSRFGPIPLRTLATVESSRTRPSITRENLKKTIIITGANKTYTIAQVHSKAQKRLDSLDLPAGYSLDVGGTAQDMKDTQARLMQALLIGVILLYVLLFVMFQSFTDPIVVMSIIPFTVGAALWGLLLFDKPLCMPANMGLIFVAGVVVNNSVLMLDFINRGVDRGLTKRKAILESLRVRIRPILMTTASTVVGLSPLVLELAVGLERLSPLAIVASTGLLVGTFLTMVIVPVVYSLLNDTIQGLGNFFLEET
jgi:multidrug efflux pump subunit AcrB